MGNENKEKELRKAALSGDPEAMLRFAIYWQEEREDAEEAGNWYRRAAEAGSKEAFLRIGKIIFNHAHEKYDFEEKSVWNGIDFKNEIEGAAAFFEKAAKAGNAEAMYYLGECFYRPGDILNQSPCTDNPRAFDWYLRASKAGNLEAKYRIGEIYYEGHCGQQKSIRIAIEYFREIAELDDCDNWDWNITNPKKRLAWLYEEIGDKKNAAYWYYRYKYFGELKKIAEDGCREAQLLIAKGALEGDDEAKELVEEGYAPEFENATLEVLSKEFSKEFSTEQDSQQQNGQSFLGWLRSLFGKK